MIQASAEKTVVIKRSILWKRSLHCTGTISKASEGQNTIYQQVHPVRIQIHLKEGSLSVVWKEHETSETGGEGCGMKWCVGGQVDPRQK